MPAIDASWFAVKPFLEKYAQRHPEVGLVQLDCQAHEFHKDAQKGGDTERQRLYPLLHEATTASGEDPERVMKLLREARQLAERLQEPRWVLVVDHWILVKMLRANERLEDYLALAVRATLEAGKPQFQDLPQRICLHNDLILGYQRQGVRNYAEEIQNAIEFMEREVSPDLECAMCTMARRITLESGLGRHDAAQACAFRMLQAAESKKSDHYRSSAYEELCWLAAYRSDYAFLETHACAGAACAARCGHRKESLALFTLWQAVAARARHEDTTARRLFRSATARLGRFKNLSGYTYDAWCEFHELVGDYSKALKLRDREQTAIQGQGRHAYEWAIQLARCRLLVRLGNLKDPDIAAARAIAGQLRKPELYLCDLDRLLAGDLSGKW